MGQRAANGMIDGRTFIHPDSNFLLQFPDKWKLDNSPQNLVAAMPDGNAAVVVTAVAEGNDPLEVPGRLKRLPKLR